MNRVLTFAIESSISLLLLWTLYAALLRDDTRHERNRFFLLASMLLSMIIPLIRIPVYTERAILMGGTLFSTTLPEVIIYPSVRGAHAISLAQLVTFTYSTGVVLASVYLLTAVISLAYLVLRGTREGRIIRCVSDRQFCFSALGFIFISKAISPDDAGRMINHEKRHLARYHHVDLLLASLVWIIQWFNPAAWLVRRSLQAIHEFETDSDCLRNGEETADYQQLLVKYIFRIDRPLLTNRFSNSSLLKKRIIMMTKEKSGKFSSLKIIAALPVVVSLVLLFSCKGRPAAEVVQVTAPEEKVEAVEVVYDTTNSTTPDNVFTVVEKMPRFNGDSTAAAFMYWVVSNLKYPDEAKEKGIEGRVIMRFIVDEEGNVVNQAIVRGADPLLDKAAYKLISESPKWEPGTQRDKKVKVTYTIPVTFKLQ